MNDNFIFLLAFKLKLYFLANDPLQIKIINGQLELFATLIYAFLCCFAGISGVATGLLGRMLSSRSIF